MVDDVGFLDSGRVFPSFKHRWIAGEIKLNIDGSSADWVCVVNLFTETTPGYGGEKCFVFFWDFTSLSNRKIAGRNRVTLGLPKNIQLKITV